MHVVTGNEELNLHWVTQIWLYRALRNKIFHAREAKLKDAFLGLSSQAQDVLAFLH